LKRDLTESERVEFLELAGAIGMGNVEDFLYMLMVFKRNEDKVDGTLASFRDEMKARFDEMTTLEQNIRGTLESSISRVLGDGAREIGRDMGSEIAESAKDVLSSTKEFHFIRGQTFVAGLDHCSFCCVILAWCCVWLWERGQRRFPRHTSADSSGKCRAVLRFRLYRVVVSRLLEAVEKEYFLQNKARFADFSFNRTFVVLTLSDNRI
jgi:hypothetical protein